MGGRGRSGVQKKEVIRRESGNGNCGWRSGNGAAEEADMGVAPAVRRKLRSSPTDIKVGDAIAAMGEVDPAAKSVGPP